MHRPDLPRLPALALGLACLLAAQPVAAQQMRLLQPAPLRAERGGEAPPLAQLAAGQQVTLLQMSGGWVRVQAGQASGWLRSSQVELPGAELAAASQLEAGRRAAGANAVTLGIRGLPPRNGRHALIVGLGSYRQVAGRPVAALAGLPQDMSSALAMALRMDVPSEQLTLLRDAAATREGLDAAARNLASQLQAGDRVFVYWSGRGSCSGALLPHDLQPMAANDIGAWLQPLLAKAERVLLVIDAGTAGAACPAGESLAAATAPNLVQVSSSHPDDAPGGVATLALRQCLLEGRSGTSVDELAACANARNGAARLQLSGPGGYVPL